MLEAARIADVLRAAANQLDDLTGVAHRYEPGTLLRKIRAIVLTAAASVVDLGEW